MSSKPVRNLIRQFLADNTDETIVDLTGHYEDLRELLAKEEVQPDAPWLGVDFASGPEEPVSLAADNQKGLYREYGFVQLHVCAVARIGVGDSLEDRGESLLNLFRGRRIGAIVVESVTPINTGPGATLEFEGGYVSGTVTVTFHYDSTPGA